MAADEMRPGAATRVRPPQGDDTATYGVTQLRGSVPVSLDDHFRIGSHTKTMPGTADGRPPAAMIATSLMKSIYIYGG